MPTRLKVVLGVLGVFAVAVAVIGRDEMLTMVFRSADHVAIDFATLALDGRPNQHLVCPEGFCAAPPHAASPVFEISATALRDRWMAMIADQPRVTRTGTDDAAALHYDFVQRSLVFRFPDAITVRFIALDAGRATLAIYSRSYYGHDDFGVNRRRVEAWLAALSGTAG